MSMYLTHKLYANYHSGGAEIAATGPGVGGLPDRLPEGRRLHRRHLHRCHDAPPRRRAGASGGCERCGPTCGLHRDHAGDLQGRGTCSNSPKESRPEGRDRARRHPRHLHVPAGAEGAPWIDAVVRGEGEQVFLNLVHARSTTAAARRPQRVRGIAFADAGGGRGVAAEPTIEDLDRVARLGHPRLGQVHLRPARRARGHPQLRPRLPVHLQLLQPVEVLARLPHPRPEEGGRRDRDAGARARRVFFILADESRPSTARSSSPSARN